MKTQQGAAQAQATEEIQKTAALQKDLMESFNTVVEVNPQV